MNQEITDPEEFAELLGENHPDQESFELFTATDLLEQDIPDVKYHVDKILPEEGLAMLAGPFKAGKSFFVLQLAICLARGEPFLGFETVKSNILILSGEGGKKLLKDRLIMMAGEGQGLESVFFYIPSKSLDLGVQENLLKLTHTCKLNNIDVVIVDPMIKFNTKDENSTREMGGFVNGLHELRHSANVAIWMAHHTRKPGKDAGSSGNEARGSSVLAGEVDSLLMLNKRGSGDFTLHFTLRWAEEPKPIRLEMNPESLFFESKGEVEGNRKVTDERIYDLLVEEGPCDIYHLAELTKTADKTVRTYLNTLHKENMVDSFTKPGERRKYWFAVQ